MTPLRQFKGVPADIIRKAEGKQFVSDTHLVQSPSGSLFILALVPLFRPGELYASRQGIVLDAYFCDPEIDELIGIQKAGRLVHRLVHRFPKL